MDEPRREPQSHPHSPTTQAAVCGLDPDGRVRVTAVSGRDPQPPRDPDAITDAEVVAYLTGLVAPLDRWCLHDGAVSFWSEQVGAVLSLRCRDWPLAVACRRYLAGRGREFRTREELARHAAACGWPGWPPKPFAPPAGG